MDDRHAIERIKGAQEWAADASAYVYIRADQGRGTFEVGGRRIREYSIEVERDPATGSWRPRSPRAPSTKPIILPT
jgi:hypothetical protein